MSDLALIWKDGKGDLVAKQLTLDESLTNTILISLFTDQQVNGERGYWADTLTHNSKPTGSKLWLLERSKRLDEVLEQAQQYANEALQWLIDDGLVRHVEVHAYAIRDVLWLDIVIELLNGSKEQRTFKARWSL